PHEPLAVGRRAAAVEPHDNRSEEPFRALETHLHVDLHDASPAVTWQYPHLPDGPGLHHGRVGRDRPYGAVIGPLIAVAMMDRARALLDIRGVIAEREHAITSARDTRPKIRPPRREIRRRSSQALRR